MSRNIIIAIITVCTFHLYSSDRVSNRPVRLPNKDDTCYINSTLQSIDNMPRLRRLFADVSRGEANFATDTAEALEAMRAPSYIPMRPLDTISAAITRKMQDRTESKDKQHDAPEYVRYAIEDLQRAGHVGADISKLLHVHFRHIICEPQEGRPISNPSTSTSSWPLYVGPFHECNQPTSFTTLPSLIRRHTLAPETLDTYTSPLNDTRYVNPRKYVSVTQLPTYLSVQITPRVFSQQDVHRQLQGYSAYGSPLHGTYIIPEVMSFSQEHAQSSDSQSIPCLADSCKRSECTYRLNSAIVYQDKGSSGHYVAYVRKGNTWYLCDDTSIQEVSTFPRSWQPHNGIYPYLLFYEPASDTSLATPRAYDINALYGKRSCPSYQERSTFWTRLRPYLSWGISVAVVTGIFALLKYVQRT